MAKKAPSPHSDPIIAFKGFDKNLQCRGMQYAIGQTFEHVGEVKACHGGLHACEYPLDVFSYYPPATSRFAVVKAYGTVSREDDGDTKIASAKLTIEAEIGIPELVQRAIEWITSRCKPEDTVHATGYQGAASATGNRGAASATGYQGAASATGYQGAASATGNQGAASATGNQGAASATGNQGAASATGKASVAMATGWEGRAKGALGCAIVLVNRDDDLNIRHIRSAKVGEQGVKPDTWYSLDAEGEFVEVSDV
jgi:hypothetical protein